MSAPDGKGEIRTDTDMPQTRQVDAAGNPIYTGSIIGQDGQTVPEGFTVHLIRKDSNGVYGPGGHRAYVYMLCCDDCGSMVGNVAAHRVLCFREERST